MTDILLIQPPIRDFYLTAKRTIPYGLTSIAAALIKEGFAVEVLDGLATSRSRIIGMPPEMAHLREYYFETDRSPFGLFNHYKHFGYSFEHLGQMARKSGALLVGISSLFTAYANDAIKMAESIKGYLPDCKIVLGGHHPTAIPEKAMESSAIDFVLRGDGEISLPSLAKALKNGSPLEAVPGIAFRKQDGSIQISEPARVKNPDRLPLPAVHLLRHHYYRRGKQRSMVIVATRGCPMSCSYCCLRKTLYRKRRVQSVIDEIETAVEQFKVGFIDFEDENLSLDRHWFLNLLSELGERFAGYGLELRAMNGLYPPSLDEEIIGAMQKAGFKALNLSLCSTSKYHLKRFGRTDVTEAFDNALDWAEKYGLEAVGYVIAGGPFQSAGDSASDLLFLAHRRVLVGLSIFYPAPGSPDFELCQNLGILPDTFSLMRSSALPLSHVTSRSESITLLRLARILNFMKLLLDQGQKIPEPASIKGTVRINCKDEIETGKQLLRWFLHDGQIRGVRPNGEIFTHKISARLTKLFIQGLKQIRIRGVKSTVVGTELG
ncbi:MAG: B12-binding domain-containing radical SAM protein [Deltaproteobacteria bacterium]|nr:MAG: B12-binding domain-containing radical SAM protein [Deltaproteobacteria bacterium]